MNLTYNPAAPPAEQALLDLAMTIARDAGDITLRWFRDPSTETEWKPDGSPVTIADRTAEEHARRAVASLRPADSFIGEEGGTDDRPGDGWWCIDPIDGTKAFVRGVPLYTTLLAAGDAHGVAAGVIYAPATGELVAAGRGLGCTYNGTPARVGTVSEPGDSYTSTSEVELWPRGLLDRLLGTGTRLRTWGDGYGFLLVATGRMDAMVDPGGMKLWDIAPHPLIIAEAQGRCTNVDGGLDLDGGSLLAANPSLHERFLDAFGKGRRHDVDP